MRQAQAAGGGERARYGYSVSVLLPTHHKKVRTCRTRQIRACSPGSDFLMIRIQMPAHWNNHSAPTPLHPQPGPDAMTRGCVPRELGKAIMQQMLFLLLLLYYCCCCCCCMVFVFLLVEPIHSPNTCGRERGRRGRVQASFSEARRNLSWKAGKKGGESWPQSQLSSAYGGEVLQEFSVVCSDPPFFPVFRL